MSPQGTPHYTWGKRLCLPVQSVQHCTESIIQHVTTTSTALPHTRCSCWLLCQAQCRSLTPLH
eukprot:COSAG01_NODE_68121_length_265_cov_0.608434_1_plen_62_part_10